MDYNKTLREALQSYMDRHGINPHQWSLRAGFKDPRWFYKFLNGESKNVTWAFIEALAVAEGMTQTNVFSADLVPAEPPSPERALFGPVSETDCVGETFRKFLIDVTRFCDGLPKIFPGDDALDRLIWYGRAYARFAAERPFMCTVGVAAPALRGAPLISQREELNERRARGIVIGAFLPSDECAGWAEDHIMEAAHLAVDILDSALMGHGFSVGLEDALLEFQARCTLLIPRPRSAA